MSEDNSPEEWNSERTINELKQTQLRVESLLKNTTQLRVEFDNEVKKRHEVHFHIKEHMKSQSELLKQMGELHADMKEAIKDMKVAIFGCDKLEIDGLVKDNKKTQKLITKITFMYFGASMAVGVLVALITNGIIKI